MSALEEDIDEEQTSILNALDAGADAFPPAPPPAAADGGDDAAQEEAAATRMQAAQRGKAARAEVAASKATGEAPATAEEEAPAMPALTASGVATPDPQASEANGTPSPVQWAEGSGARNSTRRRQSTYFD